MRSKQQMSVFVQYNSRTTITCDGMQSELNKSTDTVSRICQNPKFPSPQEGTVVATGNRQLNKENMPILGVYLLHCFSFCSPCNAILALYFQAVAVLWLILKILTLILRANKTGGNKTSPNWDSKPSFQRQFGIRLKSHGATEGSSSCGTGRSICLSTNGRTRTWIWIVPGALNENPGGLWCHEHGSKQ